MSDEKLAKAPWPFTEPSPSSIGAELDKAHRISRRMAVAKNKENYKGWSIGKSDPNERFTAVNAAQFGTRQRRKSR